MNNTESIKTPIPCGGAYFFLHAVFRWTLFCLQTKPCFDPDCVYLGNARSTTTMLVFEANDSYFMPSMMFPDAILLSVFIGTFVLAYIVWKFVNEGHNTGTKRPPALWSLPLIGSALFLPDFRIWHGEFLRMSAKMGDVFAFYMGS